MRTAIGIGQTKGGRWLIVRGMYGDAKRVAMLVSDRIANEVAFANEQAIRLPRRLGIDKCSVVTGQYVAPRYLSDGYRNRNVT